MDINDTTPPIASSTMARRRRTLRPALIGLVALLFNVALFLWLSTDTARAWLATFGSYTYLGVFLITAIANATVIIPVPYPALIASVAARSDNLALVILAGALGSALGESVGFFVGRSGRGAIEETHFYKWVQRQLRHPWRAFIVLLLLAAPPNPAFDVAGLTAGALGLPYWLFLSAVFLGRIIRIGLIALAGVKWG
jgi:membrane protein YqaA with SNARE-associated domain